MGTLKEQLEKVKIRRDVNGLSVDRAEAVEANKELIKRIIGPANTPAPAPAPAVRQEPQPKPGGIAVWPLLFPHAPSGALFDAMKQRDEFGRAKYGQPLCTADGRDSEVDALQEILDAAVYLHKAAVEREGSGVLPDARVRMLLKWAHEILTRRAA